MVCALYYSTHNNYSGVFKWYALHIIVLTITIVEFSSGMRFILVHGSLKVRFLLSVL